MTNVTRLSVKWVWSSLGVAARIAAAVAAVVVMVPRTAAAGPFTFSATSGPLAAQVTMDFSGGNLVVTLTNTSTGDPAAPGDILTGVFFDIAGDPALTPGSALICATCSITNGGPTDPGRSVGGEWAYRDSPGLAHGASYGISSAGLGLFGPGDLFGGTNLQGPVDPDGVQYGITTAFDTTSNDNGGLAGIYLISSSVIFTFSGLSANFDPSTAISNVHFQYGTSLTDTSTPVPEPSLTALTGVGMFIVAFLFRRRKTS